MNRIKVANELVMLAKTLMANDDNSLISLGKSVLNEVADMLGGKVRLVSDEFSVDYYDENHNPKTAVWGGEVIFTDSQTVSMKVTKKIGDKTYSIFVTGYVNSDNSAFVSELQKISVRYVDENKATILIKSFPDVVRKAIEALNSAKGHRKQLESELKVVQEKFQNQLDAMLRPLNWTERMFASFSIEPRMNLVTSHVGIEIDGPAINNVDGRMIGSREDAVKARKILTKVASRVSDNDYKVVVSSRSSYYSDMKLNLSVDIIKVNKGL